MFSQESRCIYGKSPLAEVVCQLRFPQILSIGTQVPDQFQEAIRDQFPRYALRKDVPAPKITGAPGSFSLENQPAGTNYQFVSADGLWRVNLTDHFISLSCCRYTRWEEFARKLDAPLAAFIQIYHPAFFERVGLRYLNFFHREALGLGDTPYRALIQPWYLGILSQEDVPEPVVARCSLDTEIALRGGCRAKIHAGPGVVRQGTQQQPVPRFVLDLDLFMAGNIPVNHSAGALETLHSQAFPIFRGSITDTLHDAMEPECL